MKLGARIFKTGIAIVLSLFIAEIFHFPSPIFAPLAAIFAIQPSIYRSYLSIIEQVQGNVIGAVVAVLSVLAFGNHILVIGLAAIFVITINVKLNIEKTISLSLVTLIAIMVNPDENFIQFALIRFATVMTGVLSAFVVNLVFLPPKYENKLYQKVTTLTEEICKWIRISTRQASEHSHLKKDIESFKEEIDKLDQLYYLYKEERNYFKKETAVKSRKLVIYRQMLSATKKALETLKQLHRFENELIQLPEPLQNEIQEQLNNSIDRHEQILLKFIDKLKDPTQAIMDEQTLNIDRKELFTHFMKYKDDPALKEEDNFFHIMQLIATIIEYDEQLSHLDTLITSFKMYHKEENEMEMETSAN